MQRLLFVLSAESGAEITKSLRSPEFVLPTLTLPALFYALFGVLFTRSGEAAIYLLATFGVFAVMGPALFGFGAAVATERERGGLDLRRTAPVPGSLFIAARLIATILFAALALLPVYAIAGFGGDVALPRSTWLLLMCCHLSATIPFALIGLTIGFTFGPNGAVAITNLVFLLLAVLGGLWVPVAVFPAALQQAAVFLPSYHLAELALVAVHQADDVMVLDNLSALALATGLFGALASWRWSRQH